MTMLKRAMLVFLALSMVMLVGDASAQSPTDVSGTWTGSTVRGASAITLVLKQDGQKVSGTLSGAGVDNDGPVTGTVDGNTIRLQSKTGATPSLNVKGNEISGMLSGGSVTLRRAN
jgi:hypothetical protein